MRANSTMTKSKMTAQFHISRNFVEFGPFTCAEIASFKERAILKDHDYVREDGAHHWTPLTEWIPAPAAPAKAKTPRKKASSVKAPKKAA